MAKCVEIVAGPNGSGKTTFAESFLIPRNKGGIFVNPDTIASGISPTDVDKASFQAGRVVLATVKAAVDRGISFAFESTLSGRTWLPLLRTARSDGYDVTIYFLLLNLVGDYLKRIRDRVRIGGHSVPRSVVLRRYPKSFTNFWTLYRPLSTNWFIFNNSTSKPALIQSKVSYEKLAKPAQESFARNFLKGKVP
jgi:predicted ABC-type ATPase